MDGEGDADAEGALDGDIDAEGDDGLLCGNGVCQPERGEDGLTCLVDCGCGAAGGCAGYTVGGCGCYDGCDYWLDCCPDACAACGFCPPTCGDGVCELGEDADSCCLDCASCGDGLCTAGFEDASSCVYDCAAYDCGDGLCAFTAGENGIDCVADCGCAAHGLCSGYATGVACSCSEGCVFWGDCCPDACVVCGFCPPVCDDGACDAPVETFETCPSDCPLTACLSPTTLESGVSLLGNLTGRSGVTMGCAGRGPEFVYKLELATPAAVTITTALPGTSGDPDTVLYVRTTCTDGSTEVGCNDDVGDGVDHRSTLTLELAAGVYFVFVDFFAEDGGGPYELMASW